MKQYCYHTLFDLFVFHFPKGGSVKRSLSYKPNRKKAKKVGQQVAPKEVIDVDDSDSEDEVQDETACVVSTNNEPTYFIHLYFLNIHSFSLSFYFPM